MRTDYEWHKWNLENDAYDGEPEAERAQRLADIALYERAIAGEDAAIEEAARRAAEMRERTAADYAGERRCHYSPADYR